ncbi:hypothetical protein [Diaphorobacter nitroreducens]
MSCSHTDLLELAKRLAENEERSEVQNRCAISRGYYACLHLFELTFQPGPDEMRMDGESSHAVIIRRARDYARGPNPGRLVAAELAKTMARLKSDRNDADYKLHKNISRVSVSEAMARVESIMDGCAVVENRRNAQEIA